MTNTKLFDSRTSQFLCSFILKEFIKYARLQISWQGTSQIQKQLGTGTYHDTHIQNELCTPPNGPLAHYHESPQ